MRNVGYRLTRELRTYEEPGDRTGGLPRRTLIFAGLAAAGVGGAGVYGLQARGASAFAPLTLAVSGRSTADTDSSATTAWEEAQQFLISELSRMPCGSAIAAGRDARAADMAVDMERLPDGPFEALALRVIETETGTVLWAETFKLDQDGYGKPISPFVADVHIQIEALGLRPEPGATPDHFNRARRLYRAASSMAQSGRAAELQEARTRLDQPWQSALR